MLGLYVSIPFCKKICNYCDFTKRVPQNSKMIDEYLDYLSTEYQKYKNYHFDTIYIGGGTPSMLNLSQMARLLDIFKDIKPIEYSIECNPDSLDEEKIKLFKKYNINRVSIGVETFDDKSLKLLGRTHNSKDIESIISLLKKNNIYNINIDLMFSLPNTNLTNVKGDLEEFYKLDINHISYYNLILEEKTIFNLWYLSKKIELVDEDLEYEMYNYIIDDLKKHGYIQYEISNFTKDKRSIHNMIYWKNQEYIGIGMGAAGYINNIRYKNAILYKDYIKGLLEEKINIDTKTKINEEMMLGLRMIDGINISEINQKYNINLLSYYPFIDKLIEENLLIITDNFLKFTKKGLMLGNNVFQYFV